MELLMNVFELLIGDVGVDLGRNNAGMPEHYLYRTDIGAILKKVGRERVTQNVRGDFF